MENPGIEPGNYQFFTLSIELFKWFPRPV
jgi:hypothetical protein